MDLPKGYILQGRYRVDALLGQGGFGKTYKVFDISLNQFYCIKELYIGGNSTRSDDHKVNSVTVNGVAFSEFKQKFVREAQDLAKFRHPNIVQVVNVFEANNTAYYVMEFIEGSTLKEQVDRNGPFHRDAAIPVMRQLLDAVEEVHKKGMLHRDIKPSNVIITDEGGLVLIDFGSAREFQAGRVATQTAMVTPGYSPWEQYSEQGMRNVTSDIYALGATMYFLLTGERPLAAPDRMEHKLPAPHELNARIDSQISSAVVLAMEMRPSDRFQTVHHLREALLQLSKDSELNKTIQVVEALEPEMVLVEGGSFDMGPDPLAFRWPWQKPRTVRVTLSSYAIGKYPVTQREWFAIMGDNPSHFNYSENCPVEKVSWHDVKQYIDKLNAKTRKTYRLPTEAEWEYAARGGNMSRGYKYAGSDDISQVAWYLENSGKKPHRVGRKGANELGLFDMNGNVWEWCEDWYHEYNRITQIHPKVPNHGLTRVLRGGSWCNHARLCGVTNRLGVNPDNRNHSNGFRLVLADY